MQKFLKYCAIQLCSDLIFGVVGAFFVVFVQGGISSDSAVRFLKFYFGITVASVVFRNLFFHYFISWFFLKRLFAMNIPPFLIATANLALFLGVYLIAAILVGWENSFFRGSRSPSVLFPMFLSVFAGSLLGIYLFIKESSGRNKS